MMKLLVARQTTPCAGKRFLKRTTALITYLVCWCSLCAVAQTRIAIGASAEDTVGKSFVFELKEVIRQHPGSYTYVEQSANGTCNCVIVRIVSEGINDFSLVGIEAGLDSSTGYPLEYFLNQWVLAVTPQTAASKAHELVVELDKRLSDVHKALSDAQSKTTNPH
jgi:hypothetical protein